MENGVQRRNHCVPSGNEGCSQLEEAQDSRRPDRARDHPRGRRRLDQRDLTITVTSWLNNVIDDEIDAVIGDDFGPGHGTEMGGAAISAACDARRS